MSEFDLKDRYGNKGVISSTTDEIKHNVKVTMNYSSFLNRIPTEKPEILKDPKIRIGYCIDKLSDYFEVLDEDGYPLPGKSDILFDRILSKMDDPDLVDLRCFIEIFDKSSLTGFDLVKNYDPNEYKYYYDYLKSYTLYYSLKEIADFAESVGFYEEDQH